MQQSCGRSQGIAKACTDGLSSQQSAKTAEQSDFMNGLWREIERSSTSTERKKYIPSKHSIAQKDIVSSP